MHRFVITVSLLSLLLSACAPSGGEGVSSPEPTARTIVAATATTPAIEFPTAAPGEPLQWAAPPAMTIDPAKIYLATFKTAKGDIQVQLFADKAPITVNNFVFLAKAGFYDNTTFHRVIADFMTQGGDPTATGMGGPGYQFEDEFHPDLTFAEPGLLAMANSGPGTNGSQFFITLAPTDWLNFKHTIFGKVVEGFEVVQSISLRDPQTAATPGDALKSIVIEEITQSLLPEPTPTPDPIAPVLVEGRPLAKLDIAARENVFNTAPALVIDPSKIYSATISTTKGAIVLELYPADAPQSVNNFYVLANLGYWDGFPIIFVQPEVFALTGSPSGAPDSDVGYLLPQELKRTHAMGAVGYWVSPDRLNSSGSLFYFMLAATPDMDAQFTVFGQVVAGQDIVAALTMEDKIETITVGEK